MSAETGCFYVPLGEKRFRATELTTSPWGSGSQQGGPPAALLGRALESEVGGEDAIFARLAFEILGPIPVGELSVEVRTVRPGRRISLQEATLSDGAGHPVMLCRTWRISVSLVSLPEDLESEGRTLPGPERDEEKPFFEMAPEKISATAQRQIFGNLQFAQELGAQVVQLKGKDIVGELVRFAREHNVSYVILGHSQRSRWEEFWHGSVINRFIDEIGEVDVQVVS